MRENAINPHPQPSSVFAQFPIVCMFNWMLGQLRKAMGRSFLEGRSYVRGRAPNLNRLSSVRENAINSHSQPNSVFAQFSVVCMFNWVFGRLKKAVGRSFLEGRSCLEGVCSWKSSESESAEQREGKEIKSRSQPKSVFARFSVVLF